MTNKNARRKVFRRRLWQENPHCCWCGVRTVLLEGLNGKEKDLPPNMATIEHMRSRFNPSRGKAFPGQRINRLACRKCNNERGERELAAKVDDQRRRSQPERYVGARL